MKVLHLVLASLVATASAGVPKPEVSIGLNIGEGASGNLGGIEPKIKWQTSGEVAGFDVEGGLDLTISDVEEKPATFVWGKVKKAISGFGDVSIRGDMDANERDVVDLDVRANGFGTSLQVVGQADINDKTASISVKAVQVTKDIDTMIGTVTINPKYDIGSNTGDVRLGYSIDKTSFQVDAEKKRLTVTHAISPTDKIAPSVSANGDFSLSYTRSLDRGKLTTTYTPDDSVKLQWTDGEWETTFKAPLEGYHKATQGIKVNMKRSVGMM